VAPRCEDTKLIIRVINFELVQPMCPRYLNVTDGRLTIAILRFALCTSLGKNVVIDRFYVKLQLLLAAHHDCGEFIFRQDCCSTQDTFFSDTFMRCGGIFSDHFVVDFLKILKNWSIFDKVMKKQLCCVLFDLVCT